MTPCLLFNPKPNLSIPFVRCPQQSDLNLFRIISFNPGRPLPLARNISTGRNTFPLMDTMRFQSVNAIKSHSVLPSQIPRPILYIWLATRIQMQHLTLFQVVYPSTYSVRYLTLMNVFTFSSMSNVTWKTLKNLRSPLPHFHYTFYYNSGWRKQELNGWPSL